MAAVRWSAWQTLIAALVVALAGGGGAVQAGPDTCRTGVYLSDLYKVSQPNRSFDADPGSGAFVGRRHGSRCSRWNT